MKEVLVILLSAVLTENFVLSKFLGVCPFLGVSKRVNSALGMSGAVIFVMTLASAVTQPINQYLLVPNGLDYLSTIVFIIVIAALVQLVETAMKKYMPPLYKSLGIYLPLITTNCAVLGVTLLNIENNYSFVEAVLNGFGGGVGFMVALLLFAGVRERIENNDVPSAFKGLPITLVAAGLVSLSFFGFSGVVDGLFQ